MIKEAKIILPGHQKDMAHSNLMHALIANFAGYTMITARGAWRPNSVHKPHVKRERVKIYLVACEVDQTTLDVDQTLRDIARRACANAQQECVYLQLPGGHVEFIGTHSNVR